MVFRNRVSLCQSSGCPGTPSVNQAGFKLKAPPAPASRAPPLPDFLGFLNGGMDTGLLTGKDYSRAVMS